MPAGGSSQAAQVVLAVFRGDEGAALDSRDRLRMHKGARNAPFPVVDLARQCPMG